MHRILNGPITLCVVVVGAVLNLLTIYVLSLQTAQRTRHSIFTNNNNSPQVRKRSSNSLIDRARPSSDIRGSQRRKPCRSYSSVLSSSSTNANRPRVYTFFVWLTISDILLLLSALFMYSVPSLLAGDLGFYVHFFPYFYLMSNTALIASVWLMCALMTDRYRTLCQPFAVRSNNISLIHRALFAVFLSALVFSLPRFFELYCNYNPATNLYEVAQTELVHNQLYMIGYRIVGGLLFYSLLPYVLLFILSFRVWLVIRSAALTRLKMNASGAMNSYATDSEMILIAVISKFLLSRLLPTVLDVVEHVVGPETFTHSSELTFCVDISNLVVVVSAGVNLIIFSAFSTSFRRAILYVVKGQSRETFQSPLSPLSTITAAPNSANGRPRLPRQLSLQTERRRATPLKRKTTVSGIPLSQIALRSTTPARSPIARNDITTPLIAERMGEAPVLRYRPCELDSPETIISAP